LQEGFYSTLPDKKIAPLPNSTGFQYNRGSLIAQRDADLKAEAAVALQQQNKRLNQAVQRAPQYAPTILLPTANALFMQYSVVPIKLIPPQGMQVTGFLVKLERRDANGNWVVVTHLPIAIAEATSPTGYTGWGAPGNGKDATKMASLPGSYRISAQVSSPHQTAWSVPISFAVTTPNKAIQKAPKAFGQ